MIENAQELKIKSFCFVPELQNGDCMIPVKRFRIYTVYLALYKCLTLLLLQIRSSRLYAKVINTTDKCLQTLHESE